jgi:hypothetical protein
MYGRCWCVTLICLTSDKKISLYILLYRLILFVVWRECETTSILLFLTLTGITTLRARRRVGAQRPRQLVQTATKPGTSIDTLVGNVTRTDLITLAPFLGAGFGTSLGGFGNLQAIALAQIARVVTAKASPRGGGAAAVRTAIVKEARVGGHLGIAGGPITFVKGTMARLGRSFHLDVHVHGHLLRRRLLLGAHIPHGGDHHECGHGCQREQRTRGPTTRRRRRLVAFFS